MENLKELFSVNNGNVFDFVGLIITLFSIPFGFYTWVKQKKQDRLAIELDKKRELDQKERELKLYEQNVRELNNRIFIELMKEYHSNFYKISLYEKDSNIIYQLKIDELRRLGQEADEVRTATMFIIDILKNAYSLLQDNNTSVCDSLWDEHFYYVFDPVRKPLFVSAFYKKAEEYQWLDNPRLNNFVSFVEQVIKENQEKNQEKSQKIA